MGNKQGQSKGNIEENRDNLTSQEGIKNEENNITQQTEEEVIPEERQMYFLFLFIYLFILNLF